MATKSRREAVTVASQLQNNPESFEFIQAVRLLEQITKAGGHSGVGASNKPSHEAIRFRTNTGLCFNPNELLRLDQTEADEETPQQWEMLVSFIGLLGSQGILPHHYSETVARQLRLKDHTMADFLDIFNQRSIGLFYRACQKYSLPLSYERHQVENRPAYKWDSFTHILRSLSGLGTDHVDDFQAISDEPLLYYTGLLSQQRPNAADLQRMLSEHFEINVNIEQFVKQQCLLEQDFQTRLPGFMTEGSNLSLGHNTVLGSKSWQIQSKFNIHLKFSDYDQFMSFSPKSQKIKTMQKMVRLCIGIELDFDIVISLPRTHFPQAQLSGKSIAESAQLGWNFCLGSNLEMQSGDNTRNTLEQLVITEQNQYFATL